MSVPYKILYVEDEVNLRSIVVEFLTSEGFHCKEANNGLEAVKLFKEENFDLLISDFRMPLMNGSEPLEWCRANKRHLPVIFVTANVELLPTENLSLEDCCAAVLYKPTSLDDL